MGHAYSPKAVSAGSRPRHAQRGRCIRERQNVQTSPAKGTYRCPREQKMSRTRAERAQGRWPNSCAVCATQWNPISVRTNWATHPPTRIRFQEVSRSQKSHKGTKQKKSAQGGKGMQLVPAKMPERTGSRYPPGPRAGCSVDTTPPRTGDPRRCGGVDEAACGARKKSRRAEPAASGRQVASVAEGTPPRARVPDPPGAFPEVAGRTVEGASPPNRVTGRRTAASASR